MSDRYIYIYGKHTVKEALRYRPDTVAALYVRDDMKHELSAAEKQAAPSVQYFSGKQLPVPVDDGAVHQGMIAKLDRQALLVSYSDFKQSLEVTPESAFVVLGEIQDPHNVGAIIRSAAAFGVQGVLVPKHRQAGITPAVLKVSVGMGFRVPLIEIGNVNRALQDLQQAGCFVYGLAGEDAAINLPDEDFSKPSVFVLGNEAGGLREKTRAHCDALLAIPMHPRCESLNASVSAAVVLYAWNAQHPKANSS